MNSSLPGTWLRTRRVWRDLSPLLLLLLFSLPASAQSNLGRIYGSITDQTGGAISAATVTVTDVARGITRPLTTDSSGEYSAGSLIPGAYTVRAEATGFRAIERKDILLNVSGDVRVDLTLQPGQQSETVTVTGELPMINTSNATLGGQIEQNQINEIPLNGRNYLHLLDYKPGMISGASGSASSHAQNGNRTDANVWVVDGIYNGDLSTGFPVVNGFGVGGGPDPSVTLPLDAILELNLQENPKAEYGYKSGAIVQVGLKSGTNAIHGGVYAFGRDKSFNARNPNDAPGEKAPFAMTQWGGTVGGPVIRDKLFFFGGIEKQRYNVAATANINTPTSASIAIPNGDIIHSIPDALADLKLNHAAVAISQLSLNLAGCGALNPSTVSTLSGTNAAACDPSLSVFNNNQNFAVNPQSKSFSFPSIGGSGNYLVKMDYHPNEKNSFNGEWFLGNGSTLAWTNNRSTQPYWRLNSDSRAQVVRAVWIWIPNSTWLNEARFGYDRLRAIETNYDCTAGPNWQTVYGLDTGVPALPPYLPTAGCAFPITTLATFGAQLLNINQGAGPLLNISKDFAGVDDVSWTRGNHQFKFGGEIHMGAFVGTGGGGQGPQTKGGLNFGTLHAFTGSTALQDFLTGTLTSAFVAVGPINRDIRLNYYAGFVQDDWRVTQRLTVNLGLRYEFVTPFRDKDNLIGNLDLTSPTGLMQQTDDRSIFNGDKNNFSPRAGLAWDITGKGTTVVRLGGSILYSSTSWSGFSDVLTVPTGAAFVNPNGTTAFAAGSNGTINTAIITQSSGFSWTPIGAPGHTAVFSNALGGVPACGNGLLASVAGGPAVRNPAPCQFNAVDPNLYTPYVTNWNLSVQHAFGNNVSLDLSYVGNHATGLRALGDINQPWPGAKNGGSSEIDKNGEQLRRPFTTNCGADATHPQPAANTFTGGVPPAAASLLGGGCFPWLGQVRYISNVDVANYNGFQAALTMRNYHGLSAGTAFTYFRAYQNYTGNENVINQSPLMDSTRPRLDYALQSVPFNLTATINYQIPGRKGFGQMLEGWAVNTSITARGRSTSGPSDTTNDLSGVGTKQDRWVMTGPASAFHFGHYFNAPCYGIAGSTYGKASTGCAIVAVGTGSSFGDARDKLVNMPAACIAAAGLVGNGVVQPGSTGTGPLLGGTRVMTGYDELAAFGCYSQSGAAIVPPAQGQFGTMDPSALGFRGDTYRNVDLSVTKTWTFNERYNAQFRAEFFDVLNRPQGVGSSLGSLTSPSPFSRGNTPNTGNGIVVGGGGPRSIQLGLKLGF